MLTLGIETVSPVHRHATYDVRGGGGSIQRVPWNLPADGNVNFSDGLGDAAVFGGLGALTDAEIQQLAERVRAATLVADIQAILEIIPTIAERQAVASRAVAIGADPSRVQEALAALERGAGLKVLFKPPSMPVRIVWGVLSTASFAASVYHGYKRNSSVGWAIWWGFMGALFPVITPTIAVAQGFGRPKHSGLGRSYRRRKSLGADLTPAQQAYVSLFAKDVRKHPEAYKADVRSDPTKYALRVIDGLDDRDVRQFTQDLRKEMKTVARHTR